MGNGVAHGMERTKPLYPAPVGALLARPMAAFEIQRAVRFEEVDAARIVFFARYLGYGHEAMEAFFGALEGGYHGLVDGRGGSAPGRGERRPLTGHGSTRCASSLARTSGGKGIFFGSPASSQQTHVWRRVAARTPSCRTKT